MATKKEIERFNEIIAGHPYNEKKWVSEYNQFIILSISSPNPENYLTINDYYNSEEGQNIETRATHLCESRYGAIFADLKIYYADFDIPSVYFLSGILEFFSSYSNLYDHIDFSLPDEKILSSTLILIRSFTDKYAFALFGIDINKRNKRTPVQEELPLIVETLKPIKPKNFIMPNNKLMNSLESHKKPLINVGELDLSVSKKGDGIDVYTMVSYEPDEMNGISIKGDNLSGYEREVSNAIISLWEQAQLDGNPKPVIYPEMIYRAMPGGGERISPGQKGAIVKAINKFQKLHIVLDATDELRKRKIIGPKATYTIDSDFLLLTHAQYRTKHGGHVVHAYRIEAEPIIYTYSKLTRQILTVPSKYLDIRKVKDGVITNEIITMNETRQTITGYLLRRIAIIKRAKQNNVSRIYPIITFDDLFLHAGINSQTSRDQKMNIREFCFDVLDYQKAIGNIKGYKTIKEGNKFTKIEILLDKKYK